MTTEGELKELEASGLLTIAAIHPELEYLFRHSLVQETAYGSLLKRERKKLHLLVGESLEQLYPDRLEELSPELALHFEEAGDDRALGYLVRAAEHAKRRYAIQEARALYDRAQRLVSPGASDPATNRLRVEVAVGGVEAGWTFSSPENEIATLEGVVETAEALGDERLLARIYFLIAMLRQFQGEHYGTSSELTAAMDRAKEISERVGDPALRAGALSQFGWALFAIGEMSQGIAVLEEAVPFLEELGKITDLGLILDGLAIDYARAGEFKLAEERLAKSAELLESGDLVARLDYASAKAAVALFKGDLDAALEAAHWCASKADEMGVISCGIGAYFCQGLVYLARGRPDLALSNLERGEELSLISYKFWQPMIRSARASALAMLGRSEEATELWQMALDQAKRNGDPFAEASAHLLRASTTAPMPNPDWDSILSDFQQAVRLFDMIGTRPFLARTLKDEGSALLAVGRLEDAMASWARALELFESMELNPEATLIRESMAKAS